MAIPPIHQGALVLVGDGRKAIFLRNTGGPQHLNLAVERVLGQENPPTREQGTDKPGRSYAPDGKSRSANEETDWHQLGEDRFAGTIADALYRLAHEEKFKELVLVAPPKVLGKLRESLHKEVVERIVAELPKELTMHTVPDIQKVLAAA